MSIVTMSLSAAVWPKLLNAKLLLAVTTMCFELSNCIPAYSYIVAFDIERHHSVSDIVLDHSGKSVSFRYNRTSNAALRI